MTGKVRVPGLGVAFLFGSWALFSCSHTPVESSSCERDPAGFIQKLGECWASLTGKTSTESAAKPAPTRLREETGADSTFVDFIRDNLKIPSSALRYKLKTLREVDSVIGSLKSPGLTTIAISENYAWAAFSEIEGRIHTGLNSVGKQQANGWNLDPSTAHEFGHGIFNFSFNQLIVMHPRIAGKYRAYWLQVLTTSKKVRAYKELFADFVAILHANDPSAVSDYIRAASDGQHDPFRIGCRDFAADNRVEGWNQSDDYLLFAPTRSHIGRNLWTKDLSPEARGRLAEKLMRAIVDEFADFYEDPTLLTRATPEQLNRRLIDRLK